MIVYYVCIFSAVSDLCNQQMHKIAFFMYFPLNNPNQCESVSCLVKPRSPVDREYYVPCDILSVTVCNQDHWTGFCRTMRGKYITYLPLFFLSKMIFNNHRYTNLYSHRQPSSLISRAFVAGRHHFSLAPPSVES